MSNSFLVAFLVSKNGKGGEAQNGFSKNTTLVYKANICISAILGVVAVVTENKDVSLGDGCLKNTFYGIVMMISRKIISANDVIT